MIRHPWLFASLLLVACAAGESAPAGDTFPLEEVVLENGLTVWLLPNPGSGLVASNVFVGAGATRESAASAGSSHFLEHLLFNGTTTYTQEELYAAVDHLGAYNNATTKREWTHFMMVAARELLDEALAIQADMLLRSTLPEDKFEKERGIVVEEISKDRDRPETAIQLALDAMVFARTPAFTRPVIGTPETIAALRRDDVLAYYRSQYVPSNMRVVLMGDFDSADALAALRRHFDAPPGDPTPAPSLTLDDAPRRVTRGLDGETFHVRIVLPMPAPDHDAYAAARLLTHLLVGSDGAWVQAALRAAPVVETTAVAGGLVHYQGATLLQLDLDLAAGQDPDVAVRRVLETLGTVAREGVAAWEWERAATAALGEAISQREQLHYFAIFAGDRLFHAPAELEATLPQRILDAWAWAPAALEWLRAPAVTVAVVGPGLPDARTPLDLAALGFDPGPALPTLTGAPELRSAPTLARAAAVQPPSQTQLPGGTTILHTAAPSTRMLGIHVLVRDRSAREPRGRAGLADLLHRMAGRGTRSLDETAFQQRLDAMGATLKVTDSPWIPFDDYYTTPLFSFIRLECVDLYAADALDLLAEMLRAPRITPESLDAARAQMDQARARETEQPAARSRAALATALYGDHPLAAPVLGTETSLREVDVAAAEEFATEYFSAPQLVLSVVGNLDHDAVLAALTPRLASLPAGSASAGTPPVPLTTASRRVEIEVGGEQAYLRLGRVVEVAPEDRWALPVAVQLASGRMQQDLREERGLAYSLGIGEQFLGTRAVLTASIGTRPQNLAEAEAGVLSYFTTGAMEADPRAIEAVVHRHLGRMRMRQVTRLGQAFRLGLDAAVHGDLEHAAAERAGMRAVTPADVARAAERYLGNGPVVTVVAR